MAVRSVLSLTLACVVLCVALCGAGCRRETRARPVARSVALIVVDAAAWKYFGIYGNELPTTPQIDRFAAGATVFTRAYAQAPWTLASTGSFLTGKYPRPDMGNEEIDGTASVTVDLQRAGLRTAAFSENSYVTLPFGFGIGFDKFEQYFPYQRMQRHPRTYRRMETRRTVDDAIAWLGAAPERPFFLYVHLLPPHCPYPAPAPFGGRFDPDYHGRIEGLPATLMAINEGTRRVRDRDIEHLRLQYQENLALVDAEVGRLLGALQNRGVLDQTLVILASDHGEAFREHGELMHNTTLYEEMIHVPLVVRFPPAAGPMPARFDATVELRSIPATICDALGLHDCADPSRSLLRRLRADTAEGAAISFARDRQGRSIASVVRGRHKLIADADTLEVVGLFDLAVDPGEKSPLTDRDDLVRELKQALAGASAPFETRAATVDRRTRERLRALGYQVEERPERGSSTGG